MMKYLFSYEEYVNEAFDFGKIKDFFLNNPLLAKLGITSLLGLLIYSIFKLYQSNQSEKGYSLINRLDPVLGNKLDQYKALLLSKLDKKEIDKIYRTLYKDGVLQDYIKKIDGASSPDEREFLLKSVDQYVQGKLDKDTLSKLHFLSYRGKYNYVITPDIIKKADIVLRKMKREFNQYLKDNDMLPIDDIVLTGSTYYWKDDIENDPNTKYGDIDTVIVYPLLQYQSNKKSKDIDEAKTAELYTGTLIKFIQESDLEYIDKNLTFHLNRNRLNSKVYTGMNLVLKIGDNIKFLVDMLVSFTPYKEWTITRFTPEKGYKGLTYGRLLFSFNNIFNINVAETGVNIWLTPSSKKIKSKRDTGKKELFVISRNYGTFLLDIAYWLGDYVGIPKNKLRIDSLLKENPGLDKNNIELEILLKGTKGLINTLDDNGIFAAGIFPEIYNKRDAFSALYNDYMNELNKRQYNFKYNNIENDPAAKYDYERTKMSVDHAKELADKYLKYS